MLKAQEFVEKRREEELALLANEEEAFKGLTFDHNGLPMQIEPYSCPALKK